MNGATDMGKLSALGTGNTFSIFSIKARISCSLFLTSTIGGGIAVRDLRASTDMARRLRGNDNLFARIQLRDAFMKTGTGGRQRPAFTVIDYISIGNPGSPGGAQLNAPVGPINGSGNGNGVAQIETKPAETQPVAVKAEESKPEVKAAQPKAGQKATMAAAAKKSGKISPKARTS